MLLEIAVFNIASALQAAGANADRLELCENPADGGTTPSAGFLKLISQQVTIPVFPIIRPRGGDFFYSKTELAVMEQDILLCKSLGFPGIVTGALKQNGEVDFKNIYRLVEIAYPMEVTFHRAFDRAIRPLEALEQIIDCGCNRILTSGQQPDALSGKELIKELVLKADERLIILPGSGVRKENIRELIDYTGVTEVHSSARQAIPSAMEYVNPAMQENLENITVDTGEISAMKRLIS